MYDLPYHKAPNEQAIKELIEKYPFAFLAGCDPANKPVATQVPLFLEERDGRKFLTGHLMKNTDHHKAFQHNNQVLAVFTGNHTYVSGAWYSDPHTASTWNYMSVHARGAIRFLDGAALEEMLRKTSMHFENNDPDSPTVYDNLPKSFLDKVMKAIVAFEIEVTEMDNVFKLSQDRDEKSYHNIIGKLKNQGEDGKVIATEMEKQAKNLYPGK
ncbi:FMN-binding negative transcriptional regulator [Ekhidna sp.]|uniref:FMN-binding negative transcriptional regulator n=1 Tax=Ekhidna sp. TaxID=2608089 RepID=UPI003C7CFD49